MLKVNNISSGYGKKQILFNISFQANKGEVISLSGGNGSGKSTLLKCIYNLLPCWTGEIYFEEKKINSLYPYDLIKLGIVYLPQKDFCFEDLTVDENLRVAGNIYSKEILKNRIKYVYDEIGIKRLRNQKPYKLSGGERKLLAFGMTILHKPKILLLDEPFEDIDIRNAHLIEKVINSYLSQGNVIAIITEHRIRNNLGSKRVKMELGTLN